MHETSKILVINIKGVPFWFRPHFLRLQSSNKLLKLVISKKRGVLAFIRTSTIDFKGATFSACILKFGNIWHLPVTSPGLIFSVRCVAVADWRGPGGCRMSHHCTRIPIDLYRILPVVRFVRRLVNPVAQNMLLNSLLFISFSLSFFCSKNTKRKKRVHRDQTLIFGVLYAAVANN